MTKNCLIAYFSGTGNTEYVANHLKSHLSDKGYSVTLFRLRAKADLPDISAYDILVLGYPIHAFNAPEVFVKFVRSFPKTANKSVFLFKVSGEPFFPNRASSGKLVSALRKRGYNVKGERNFLMPYNIVFRYPDAMVKEMLLYIDPLSELFSREIERDEPKKISYPFYSYIYSFLFRIEWLAPRVNRHLVKVDTKRCTNCNLCIRQCPMQALYKDEKGRIKINSNCSLCMNCTYRCPKDAIRFGFLNHWKVNGPYPYGKIIKDETLPSDYAEETKDYFHHFRKYYRERREELQKANIPLPEGGKKR